MIHRTHRLRRVAAALALGIGGVAGVIGVTAGTASATTTANAITAAAATSVHPTGTAQAGAAVHVTFTHAVAAITLTLTVTSTGGTTKFSALPVVTATGFSTHTVAFTATHHKVKVTLVETAAHTTEKVTFATVKFVTSHASGTVKIAASSTPTETFTGSPVTDATVTGSTTSRNNTITASSSPTIAKTGTNQAAGNLKITLHNATGAAVSTSTLTLGVATTGHSGTHVKWTATPTVTCTGCSKATAAGPSNTGHTVVITTSMASGASATVTVTNVHYNTTTAIGTVTVTPTWKNSTGTTTLGSFTPASATNAVATHTTPPSAPTESVVATSTPSLQPTGSGQAGGTWTIHFTGAKNTGWAKTKTFSVNVFMHDGTNCTAGSHGYVLFTGVPKATVSGAKNVSTTPTVKVTTSAVTPCSAASHNQVTVTFTNTGTFTSTTSATNKFSIVLSGVKYNAHKGTSESFGTVDVGATKTTGGLIAKSSTVATSGPSNANIAAVVMSGNTPAVSMTESAFNAAISPVNVIEQVAGSIPSSDYVCITLTSTTNHFNAANTATATVKSGNGAATKTVVYYSGTTKVTSGAATTAVFKVKTASSTTKPSTYTVTGLHVNAASGSGTVSAVGTYSATAHCGAAGVTGTSAGTAVAYTINVPKSKRIAGTTAAATAAAQLEYQFPATSAANCPGNTTTANTTAIGKRAVILANQTHFPDALSSQYLAGRLHTGTLLASGTYGGTSVPAVTLNAMRLEGISHVYVIGGPLAISTTVVKTLESTPQYACGGTSVRTTSTGTNKDLVVTRIGGQTQYDTAEMVATFLPKSDVGTGNFAPAYAGVNKTGGNGKFNDTKGNASPAGINASETTAVVADGQVFQDAMSAGAFAYAKGYPILLTTPSTLSLQVPSAIHTLTIQQVIVMGGQLAVSDAVVTSLEAQGVSVLRIAGADYTDTAVQAADFEIAASATGGLGWTPASLGYTAAVARGNGFSDGLAGAVITGNHDWALLLTENPTSTGSYLTTFLKNAGAKGFGVDETATGVPYSSTLYRLSSLVVFGGTLAITPTVVKTMQTDLNTG